MAMVHDAAIAKEIDLEGGERFAPFRRAQSDMVFWPDQQGAVYAVCSDSVGGGEFPPRKNRLHDFEPMRHPLHAGKERGLVHLWLRRSGKTEYDFRLDAWLGKSGQAERCCIAQVVQSRFIDVAPYRGIDFVFLPDRPVGKTDFAADAL